VPFQFDTRKIPALAAYIAMAGPVSRDALMAMLWPELEPGRAQAVLRRNLSLLKKALEGEWLVIDRREVGADPQADFWLDVGRFRHLVQASSSHGHPAEEICPRCLAELEEAAALYRGDFLGGFTLRDSVAFDDWQFFEAEALRQELAAALDRLVRGHLAHHNGPAAQPHARRRLALDPLHEPAHRQLMALYAQAGQRSAALRQYRECARILDEELGLAPDSETTALHEQIRSGLPAAEVMLWSKPGPGAAAGHNLPAQATPFVGRKQELAEVRARLEDPACRLLTLLGPGGIGKTRLALRAAEELAQNGRFKHGVFFCPLATIACCQGVVPAVAEALSYQFRPEAEGRFQGTPRGQLIDYMRRKQLLLVLDNYEHLLVEEASPEEALGLIADLLAAAPGVKLLVTSRASLQVQGEHLYPVQGLQVPPGPLARLGSRPVAPVKSPAWQNNSTPPSSCFARAPNRSGRGSSCAPKTWPPSPRSAAWSRGCPSASCWPPLGSRSSRRPR
jgi:DNA-binding SARP family transcriptional activator